MVGKSVTEVSSDLTAMGLTVDAVAGTPLPEGDPKIMTVYDASPLGSLKVGSTIQIFYYVQETASATPTPTDSPTATPSP